MANGNTAINLNNTNSQTESLIQGAVKKKIKTIHEFTKVGFSGYGVKKVNQDNYFIFRNFSGNPNYIYMAVW